MNVDWLKLAVCVGVCELAGVLGALFTASAISTWYAALVKPVFVPPSWLFGPVWIFLYALMGVSLYLVLQEWEKSVRARMGVSMAAPAKKGGKKAKVVVLRRQSKHRLALSVGVSNGHVSVFNPVFLALAVFGFQLVLNVLWSVLFFGLHSPFLGFAAIVVLLLAVVDTARLFFLVSKPAGLLLFPYVLWTAFATILNFAIWRLN